jgi:DNA-binding MarR family transcriptional regulator
VDEQDHVDRFLATLSPELQVDLEVEGIVDRINGLSRRIKRTMQETTEEHGLGYGEWHLLARLHNSKTPLSPGELSKRLELSSGAMTNRLDHLERRGLVLRRANPDDRRALLVELTPEGTRLYRETVRAQAEKENVVASALSAEEKQQLNVLLRRLMLAFERASNGG